MRPLLFRSLVVATLLLAPAALAPASYGAAPRASASPTRSLAGEKACAAIRAEIGHLSGMSKTFRAERIWLAPLSHGRGYRWRARVRAVVTGYATPRSEISLAAGMYDARTGKVTIQRLPTYP